jgi:hypothetical protein
MYQQLNKIVRSDEDGPFSGIKVARRGDAVYIFREED